MLRPATWVRSSAWLPVQAVARWAALLLLAACTMFSPLTRAAEKAPVTIDAGIYLNSVPSVALKERKFQANFNLWFRWSGDAANGIETFSIVDGVIDSKEELVKKKVGDVNYVLYRVMATIHNNFDVSRYPLDDHALKIQIEDLKRGTGEMVFRADVANSKVGNSVHVPGWNAGNFSATAGPSPVGTNYGDGGNAKSGESGVSRFTFALELRRNGYGNFFKLFSMLFFAGILSFFAFRVRSDYLDSRLALIVSGIFMAAITASMIASTLPESDSFDMAEELYFGTMGFIFTACLGSLYTFKLHVQGQEERAHQLSRRMGMVLPVAYVIINILIVVLAHNEI